ncbi:MAG: 50S ribosomal protein L2 [Candidatus Thermoplasmatota archaeon]|jgi:large subunit ribosomal protein L2|nr:50S ribosomal protein L2 [Candidatus Thermoplasmatota archaeon]
MGKRLIQQRRGRVRGRYNAPSHRFRGDVKYIQDRGVHEGFIEDIMHDPGRSAPVASVKLNNSRKILTIATEGMKIGDKIKITDSKDEAAIGNVLPLSKIPDGYMVYNVELSPGDGGKLARAGGNSATIVSHELGKTTILLPSGKFKTLDSSCRATIGVVAGGGRKDKPFVKAGKKFFAYRSRGKQYPVVRGTAMNPVAHPHGGGSHQHIGKPSSVKRGAPPGRKVGSIAPKRTGRR